MTATIDLDLDLPEDFPVYDRGDTRSAILDAKATLGLVFWGEASPEFATIEGGAVSTLFDVAEGSGTFAQGTSGNRAVLGDDLAGDWPALVFDGPSDFYTWSGGHDLGSEWSLVALFQHDGSAPSAGRGVLAQYSASNSQRGIYRDSTGGIRALHRAGSLTLGTIASNTPHLVIMSADGANFWGKLDDEGVMSGSNAGSDPRSALALGTNNAASPASAHWRGWIAGWMVLNKAILKPGNEDALALILEHYRGSYGLW